MEKKTMESIKQNGIRILIKLMLVMIVPVYEWIGPYFGFTLIESWIIGAACYAIMRGVIDDVFSLMDLQTLKETIKDLYESIGVKEKES